MITNNVSKFITVYENYNDSFNKAVNNLLEEGWLLYGQPFQKENYYCQAMVKLNKKERTVV